MQCLHVVVKDRPDDRKVILDTVEMRMCERDLRHKVALSRADVGAGLVVSPRDLLRDRDVRTTTQLVLTKVSALGLASSSYKFATYSSPLHASFCGRPVRSALVKFPQKP